MESVGNNMKFMVISDIHGSLEKLEQVMARFKEEDADKLLILGDFPDYRNSLYDYAIAENLNEISSQIIAVRGNCDGPEIEELLEFKLEDLRNIELGGLTITMTHGHLYNKNKLPKNCGKIFLQGHSHCAEITKVGDQIIANPGSISKPRNGAEPSYLIIDELKILLKNFAGKILAQQLII